MVDQLAALLRLGHEPAVITGELDYGRAEAVRQSLGTASAARDGFPRL